MWFGCTTTEINQAMESLPGLLAQTGQTGGGLSQADIVAGLKSALSVGSGKASTGLHKTDAFFRNSAIKILFPAEAAKVKSILDKAGLDRLTDKVVLSLNRAAEDAAVKAKPIFVSAIKSMTIQDGLNILFGSDGAATSYLKRTTSQQLVSSFRPSITRSLSKVNATKHWSDVMQAYNQIPFMKQINPDLSSYVTQKALDGIFYAVAKEEKNIRDNPKARVTGILQKVFGYRDSKK
jgi:hypothetical protein